MPVWTEIDLTAYLRYGEAQFGDQMVGATTTWTEAVSIPAPIWTPITPPP